jgi:hypothetical protein
MHAWRNPVPRHHPRVCEDRLKNMTFLKESKILVTGSGNARDFGFHFRSNPIPIAKVTVRGYGLLNGLSEGGIPSLAVHPGDIYSQSRVGKQENSLEEASQRAD